MIRNKPREPFLYTQPRKGRKRSDNIVVDDTRDVRSFGAVAPDFDKRDETIDYYRNMAVTRGVI